MGKTNYEKFIGYCFNVFGRLAILKDVLEVDDGFLLFQMQYCDTGEYFVKSKEGFIAVREQTTLPKL